MRLIASLLMAALLVGCGTVQWNGTQSELDRMQAIAQAVSYMPVSLYLLEHPEAKDKILLVKNALDSALAGPQIDPGALAGIVGNLPMDELRAKQVAIILTGALLVINEAGGQVNPVENSAQAKAVAIGLRNGLSLALQIADMK